MTTTADPAEVSRLLANVRKATRRSERARAAAERRYQQALARANEPRKQAILACFDAKIPRKDIARAAEVTPTRLYQIVGGDTPEM